ncbi:3599_t:CDS:1, partial [Paraglomus occultum]
MKMLQSLQLGEGHPHHASLAKLQDTIPVYAPHPPKKTMAETLKKSISKNETKPPKPVEHQTTTTITSS